MGAFEDVRVTASFRVNIPDRNGRILTAEAIENAIEYFKKSNKLLPLIFMDAQGNRKTLGTLENIYYIGNYLHFDARVPFGGTIELTDTKFISKREDGVLEINKFDFTAFSLLEDPSAKVVGDVLSSISREVLTQKYEKPDCFKPEADITYPLCIGESDGISFKDTCKSCACFKDFELYNNPHPEEYMTRVYVDAGSKPDVAVQINKPDIKGGE